MIFAELQYDEHYELMHKKLLSYIKSNFGFVRSGLQCDSWIWIQEDGEKVEIDTFSAMVHQIKSSNKESKLVHRVIEALESKYKIKVFDKPVLEPHEDI
ncbi:MAG: hypothetical protein JAY98_01155 [Candidatus Thiodiazotropha lotti]|nr:hypothetical protein [Candidatus Thiodiazotropha lotti]MCW4181778.1 hypothetical protein [Candidatus Thiodiazotropha weberae]